MMPKKMFFLLTHQLHKFTATMDNLSFVKIYITGELQKESATIIGEKARSQPQFRTSILQPNSHQSIKQSITFMVLFHTTHKIRIQLILKDNRPSVKRASQPTPKDPLRRNGKSDTATNQCRTIKYISSLQFMLINNQSIN